MDLCDIFLIIVLISIVTTTPSYVPSSKNNLASACYGTSNNFLDLACQDGEFISVTNVVYGAKLKADNCPNPTVNNEHDPSCCYRTADDCIIIPLGVEDKSDPYMQQCDNETTCHKQTMWMDTTGHCDDEHMAHTNYMELTYDCLTEYQNGTNNIAAHKPSSTLTPSTTSSTSAPTTTVSTTTTTTKTTTPKTTTTSTSTSTTTTTRTKIDPKTTVKDSIKETKQVQEQTTTLLDVQPKSGTRWSNSGSRTVPGNTPTLSLSPSPSPSPGRHVEVDVSFTTALATERNVSSGTSSFAFTTGMMGGMTAAIVGLMLTIFGFIFYWGRRKRKMTTMKPNNSTVWDFLLAHTVAARTFRRGYDNFSNNRESVSSEGEVVTHGKQTWLPNIRVEPNIETQSVTSDENCSIVNINTIGSGNSTVSSQNDRSEA